MQSRLGNSRQRFLQAVLTYSKVANLLVLELVDIIDGRVEDFLVSCRQVSVISMKHVGLEIPVLCREELHILHSVKDFLLQTNHESRLAKDRQQGIDEERWNPLAENRHQIIPQPAVSDAKVGKPKASYKETKL